MIVALGSTPLMLGNVVNAWESFRDRLRCFWDGFDGCDKCWGCLTGPGTSFLEVEGGFTPEGTADFFVAILWNSVWDNFIY